MEMYSKELSKVTALKEMANCLVRMEWNMTEPGGEIWYGVKNGLLLLINSLL